MRSQLRLRILLPVAVLGLLGVGVGAFAMGGPPEGGAAPATTVTTQPTTTTTEGPPPASGPSLAEWAASANEFCAKVNSQVRRLGQPPVPDQQALIAYLEDIVGIVRSNEPGMIALGWPTGRRAQVKQVWAAYRRDVELGTAAVEALKAGDREEFFRLSKRLNAVGPSDGILQRFGADRCLEDTFAPADPERGLSGALAENRVVVVLFYTPGSDYDALQAREARAGAAAGGAGFLAVDASKDREVAALAAAFQIRDAPAILVVKKGFRIAVRMSGFADRETIAQAAANARG
jgi:hypothetical protein